MIEIRVKCSEVQEVNDLMSWFQVNCFPGFTSTRLSKAYVMRNGQYKFFVECLDNKTYDALKVSGADIGKFLDQGIKTPCKKRGRKPKGLKLL